MQGPSVCWDVAQRTATRSGQLPSRAGVATDAEVRVAAPLAEGTVKSW